MTNSSVTAGNILVRKLFDARTGFPVACAVADVRVKAIDRAAQVARKKAEADHRGRFQAVGFAKAGTSMAVKYRGWITVRAMSASAAANQRLGSGRGPKKVTMVERIVNLGRWQVQ